MTRDEVTAELKDLFPAGLPWEIYQAIWDMSPDEIAQEMKPEGKVWFARVLLSVPPQYKGPLSELLYGVTVSRSACVEAAFVTLCENLMQQDSLEDFGYVVRSQKGDIYVRNSDVLQDVPKHLRDASEIVPVLRLKNG